MYSSDVLDDLLRGRQLASQISDFAFLTIVCNIRCRICLFENLSHHYPPNLKTSFIEAMDTTMNSLSQTWLERSNYDLLPESLPPPLKQHTKSALDSAFFHLYSSHELSNMKRLLQNPEILDQPQELSRLFQRPNSPRLQKALRRAARSCQLDWHLGVNYLAMMAPFRFDPLEVPAVCERSRCMIFWNDIPL